MSDLIQRLRIEFNPDEMRPTQPVTVECFLLEEAAAALERLTRELGETNDALAACQSEGGGWKLHADRVTQSLLIERGKLEKADEENERLQARLAEYETLKRAVNESTNECGPDCDEHGHGDKCPANDPARWLEDQQHVIELLRARLGVLERQQSAQDALAGYGIDAKGALADVCREMAGRSLAAEARLAERERALETAVGANAMWKRLHDELQARLSAWDISAYANHDPVSLVSALIVERDEYEARLAETERKLTCIIVGSLLIYDERTRVIVAEFLKAAFEAAAALAAKEGK